MDIDTTSMTRQLSWVDSIRFQAIEILVLWEGGINSSHLQNIFNIGRQKASKLLGEYQDHCPDNLIYDASLKSYVMTSCFTPSFSQGVIDEYQQLSYQLEHGQYVCGLAAGFDLVEAPFRAISPQLVQPILMACRDCLRLDIGYASLSSPDYSSRIIIPHSIVFDGLRWHVRAFCEKNLAYRDFVLSRFNGEYVFEGTSSNGKEQDLVWNTWVDVVIVPDPRLSSQQCRIIEMDYQMQAGGE